MSKKQRGGLCCHPKAVLWEAECVINKDLRSVGTFGTGVANCKSRKRSIFSQNKDALSFILLGFLSVVPAVASVCVCVLVRTAVLYLAFTNHLWILLSFHRAAGAGRLFCFQLTGWLQSINPHSLSGTSTLFCLFSRPHRGNVWSVVIFNARSWAELYHPQLCTV